ncbi:branched-chain amino acid ABC transporter permease [Caldinitratiruptor microaerophilus]|uniref:Branched-chain amino acid ABC transporter permease n=1 Tax=Caldinitratiruptor microaerophilus TaxID=671077 RepID=A0AA35CQA0_9FIRM|nr:branched-chain amino acid ABC transporter permease [Caldinitratiruptor microaerophilus]BDG61855.1 branched-chain amino acid ABC transporter permease [Caldinitratiruptor microaerophilus]
MFLEQLLNGLQLGLVYALIALGYTMVYGIIKLINFAHGDVFMVGAYLGVLGYTVWKLPFPVAVVVAMAGAAVLGVTIERLAYRPLRVRNAPRIAALITAIGVSLFLEYFSSLRFVFGPNYRVVDRPFKDVRWQLGPLGISNIQVIVLLTVIALLLLLQFVVYRTKIGKAMRAVSFDMDAARLMGIDVDRVISFTFAIGSALAAAAGILYVMAYPQIYPFMGIMPGLKAFTAAVLGGIGNIPGAVLGALIMGMAEVFTVGYVTSDYRDAVAFSILILVLLVRPAGLLGKAGPEKV